MRPKVYLETTIASYLTAKPSRNILLAAHQQFTRRWWTSRHRFELFISEAVMDEVSRGDRDAVTRRLAAFEGLTILPVTAAATQLAELLSRKCALPEKAHYDAVHIAVSAVNKIDYLLTWNCTHIANASLRAKIQQTCRDSGFDAPIICMPYELEAHP